MSHKLEEESGRTPSPGLLAGGNLVRRGSNIQTTPRGHIKDQNKKNPGSGQ